MTSLATLLTEVRACALCATHLPHQGSSVTEVVQGWRQHWPATVALPHPSPRNNRWLQRNPWFEQELLPLVRERVAAVLAQAG